MKRLCIGIIMVLLTITLVGCKEGSEEPTELNSISEQQITEYFENNDTFLLLIGSKTCTGCTNYKDETIAEYLKQENALPVYFLDEIESFDKDEAFDAFIGKYGIIYTTSPTTYYVKSGQVIDQLVDNQPLEQLNKFITDNTDN